MKKITYLFITFVSLFCLSVISESDVSSNTLSPSSTQSTRHFSSVKTKQVRKSKKTRKTKRTRKTKHSSSEPSSQPQPAPQAPDQETSPQEQDPTVYVARDGTADVYWYSMGNMPGNTNRSRVVQMKESEAIAAGKRHTMKEP